MIHVEGLGKSFLDYQRGWVSAVRDVSFDCRPGEVFGLLGPNGAGKTTTLRILSTVLKPTSGRAVVAGYDVVQDPENVRRHIGYMSASTGIYDRMTAWELVEYFGRLYGLPKDRLRERMETIFGWLKMDDFRNVLGSKMSTGMKQKVSIARTIVHDPPVLIFDEATSALDSANERAIQAELQSVARNKTTLVIAHRLSTVVDAHEILVMEAGRIIERGSHAELLAANGRYAQMWALQQSSE